MLERPKVGDMVKREYEIYIIYLKSEVLVFLPNILLSRKKVKFTYADLLSLSCVFVKFIL